MASRKINKKLSRARPTISKRRSSTSHRRFAPQPRHRPNPFPVEPYIIDDDAPKILPHFYKNPAHLVKDGDEIAVWWEGDEKFYTAVAKNLRKDQKRRIEYEDGEVMYHDLTKELFVLSGKALERLLASKYPEVAEQHLDDRPIPYPDLASLLDVGDRVTVYRDECKYYFPGTITGEGQDGWYSISYDNGDKEGLRMVESTFRFIAMSAVRAYSSLI